MISKFFYLWRSEFLDVFWSSLRGSEFLDVFAVWFVDIWISECFLEFFLGITISDCLQFGSSCEDQNICTFSVWMWLMGIKFSDCLRVLCGDLTFLNVRSGTLFGESEFRMFFGVLSGGKNFRLVFLEIFVGSKFLHAFSRRVLCGDQNFWLSFGKMCGGLGSEILHVFSSFYGSENSWMFV